MLTPREFAFVDPRQSTALGLPAAPHGLLLCTDEHGYRRTLVTTDVAYAQALTQAPVATVAELEIPPGKFSLARVGWPDEWLNVS